MPVGCFKRNALPASSLGPVGVPACSKSMIDHMHGNHIGKQQDIEYPTDITRTTLGFHVYDNQARSLTPLCRLALWLRLCVCMGGDDWRC